MSALKRGEKSSSAIIGEFLKTVFLFFLWPNNKMFLNSFRRFKLTCLFLKEPPLEASFYGFYKDKHRKLCAIMTEILPHFG